MKSEICIKSQTPKTFYIETYKGFVSRSEVNSLVSQLQIHNYNLGIISS